jgi:ribose 5-phosphate isomerase B
VDRIQPEASRWGRAELRQLVADTVERVMAPEPAEAPPASAPASAAPAPTSAARWVRWVPAPASAKPQAAAPAPPIPAPQGGKPSKPVIAVGSDHSAVALKNQIVRYLREELGNPVIDCGAPDENPVDYPDIARAVGRAVVSGKAQQGIVIDAMGIGSTMAANKVPGVRCALCHDEATTKNAREHNDANVLALGSRVVNGGVARALVRLFLATPHAGGRHARRVAKITQMETTRA